MGGIGRNQRTPSVGPDRPQCDRRVWQTGVVVLRRRLLAAGKRAGLAVTRDTHLFAASASVRGGAAGDAFQAAVP
jgi:hypothetical protein